MAMIQAQERTGAGKGVARKLRRAGRIPAVLYGGGQPNVNLSLDAKEWGMLLSREQSSLRTQRQNMVIDGTRRAQVLMRDVQFHPLSGLSVHADFMRFDPNQRVDLAVPVQVVGEEDCPGIKEGGVLQTVRHELEVSCLAKDVPNFIKISVGGMAIGDSIHIDDVVLPEGVTVHREVNFTIVAVVAVKAETVAEGGDEAEDGTEVG